MEDPRSDEQLLMAVEDDPEALGTLYRRHVSGMLGFFLRRTGNPELAADLTAETFAAALDGSRRFDPARGPAVAWLYGIARRQLSHLARRGQVESRARRRLRMPPLVLDDEGIERVEQAADAEGHARVLHEALDRLGPEQRAAIEARVLDESSYEQIARTARTSQSVIRQRVSRGLGILRSQLEEEGRP